MRPGHPLWFALRRRMEAGTDLRPVEADDGPGIPPDQLPRIFDRFYRARVPSRRPGSGLGLAIAAAVAAAHDGHVAAVAGEPHGLRIILTLPMGSPHAPLAREDAG